MVVYVGRVGVQHWVDREVRYRARAEHARSQTFKLIPVFGEGADVAAPAPVPESAAGHLRQGSRGDPAAAGRAARRSDAAVPSEYWAAHSPFRSLQAFDPDDAWLFFGRDRETDALVARLQTSKVLVVIGSSGSGKSSLVRAGLIPALRRGRFVSQGSPVERWRIAASSGRAPIRSGNWWIVCPGSCRQSCPRRIAIG